MRRPAGAQAALAALSQAVLAGTAVAALAQPAVTLSAAALGADYGALWERAPDGGALVLRAAAGGPAGAPGALPLPAAPDALAAAAVRAPAPVLVADWANAPPFPPPAGVRARGVCSSLYVAIPGPGGPWGVLGFDRTAPGAFAAEAADFVQAVANLLALAVDRARGAPAPDPRAAGRHRELQQRRQVAESLHQILTILNSNRALDDMLGYIIAQACRLLGPAAGAIYRLDPGAGQLQVQASWGLDAADTARAVPVAGSVPGQAVRTRQPQVVTDTGAGTPEGAGRPAEPAPDLRARYPAQLAVPLLVKTEVYGAIALYYPQPRAFVADEVRLAVALSHQAALAIENARLIAGAQDQAILAERQRLARDLHDSVTQSLYSVTLHAQAATRLLAANDLSTVAHYLHELQDIAQEALDEMRLLIFELRPPVLDQGGLAAALRARLDTVEARAHLETQLIVDGSGALPKPVEQGLYRIAQEALNNALKHAHAQHVVVRFQQTPAAVVLEISDDGSGFDPAQARATGGLGLRGIAERAVQLGGQLSVQSTPGRGTHLRVEVGL